MTKIIMEDCIADNIPILCIYQIELKKCPLIFFLHRKIVSVQQVLMNNGKNRFRMQKKK